MSIKKLFILVLGATGFMENICIIFQVIQIGPWSWI